MWRKYDDEFKRQTVKKVIDGQFVVSVAQELGVNESLIPKWKRAVFDTGNGVQSGSELKEMQELKKRIRELEMENAHLKKGGTYLRQRKLERYKFIESQKEAYPIQVLCRVMKVQRSAYYLSVGRKTFRQNGNTARIKECFDFNCRRSGSRRIAASLKIGRATVQKVMEGENLRAIQPRSFKPQRTDSKHGLPVCANLLQGGANAPIGKGEVFIGDITYLRLRDGSFCYLACLQDKFTRRIVG